MRNAKPISHTIRLQALALALGVPLFAAQAQDNVEEIVVLGRQEFRETQFTPDRSGSNVDAAKLMTQVPGGAANNNGPLTGQIQYRGMFGPRINVRVDGMLIHGGGPNWMAPPLHHIPAGLMKELVVEQGIAAIATGGGIGGAATALWKKPDYGFASEFEFSGDTEFGFGTADSGSSGSAVLGLASDTHRFFLVGSHDQGDDYESAAGEVDATQYERGSYGIGYGFRTGAHEIDIEFRRIETDDTGTPSLPMDIDWFYTDLWNASYKTNFNGVGFELRIYGSDIDHGMTNFALRPAPDFSSLPLPPFVGDDKRTVATDSEEFGFKLALDWQVGAGDLIVGLEGKDAEHNAAVGDPDFAPFFVNNFNGSDVENLSAFAQWSAMLSESWYFEAGIRSEQVRMSTGSVDAFPARLVDMNPAMWPMGSPPRAVFMLRENFNNADRRQEDRNTDWVLKSRFQATDNLVIEAGVAQKMRSPLYQERYLWIPLEANAGLGDGNNYVGNPDLKPEESLQYELGFDWSYANFYVSPRIYHRKVDDYIQGIAATNPAVIGVSRNANGDPTPLMFANTDAEFSGIDVTFGAQLSSSWRFDGVASMVDGEREDVNDNLYRVTPDNIRLSLTYEANNYNIMLEQVLVSEQEDISLTNTFDPTNINNNSAATDSYALTNAYLNWQVSDGLSVTAGVENLFDDDYVDHLSGFNRVIGSVVPQGSRMFGQGRNLFGRVQIKW